ncbi:MAG: hypothetical protein ABL952_07025 [Pyrinomonadaceae bacterium]
MKPITRFVVSFALLFIFLSNTIPCGPGYITPMFDTSSAPEAPYTDYASGRLGIVKPSFHRSVLIAAYKYIAGNGLNAAEQQAMIEVWKAEIDNKDFADDTVDEAVKAWVARRKEVVGKEEKTPDIYVERSYGGYDFFPNCTKNAFETAAETLSDRTTAHGPSDTNVQNWVRAQDQVFQNCASGKQQPDDTAPGAPDWLQKDRAYQKAAAEFYSLDYESAKKHFAEIAQDTESPWAETADYLVARTLIRQASLSKSKEKTAEYYAAAELRLEGFVSRTGKFSPSSERMLGLVKFRTRPKERVSELAKQISFYAGNENFRQNIIDYTWLLDKFENELLLAEEKRKLEEQVSKLPPCTSSLKENCRSGNTAINGVIPAVDPANTEKKNNDDLEINIYSPTGDKSWQIIVKADATDADAVAEAERVIGIKITDEMRKQVREMRQSAYANRFKDNQGPAYEGGYWGEITFTPTLLPDFLKQDELTDWLYTYQMQGAEAYLYALSKYKATSSELWLMTALSKAEKSSTELPRLLQAANETGHSSPGYPTIAYHTARILLEQNKQADARKIINEMLETGDQIPISTRNSFLGLKLKTVESMDEYLTYSLRKPFGFDFDGDVGSVDDIIAEQKKWFDPEYNKEGREAYEKEVEDRYKNERLWQSRTMFDSDTIESFNQLFPTAMLIEVEKSPALPEYLRERFVMSIWVRAYLLKDAATLEKMTPELIKYNPDFEAPLAKAAAAKTEAAREAALLYFVLKNPVLTPYLEDGIGREDNEQGQWDANDWWCAPYDTTYDDATNAEVPKPLPKRPPFLTAAQTQTAQAERKRLREMGDAPKYLAARVMEWAKKTPTDKRVPEALFIVIGANGWTKYGCGNDEEIREEYAKYLKTRYPSSPWTAKLIEEEKGQ